MLLAALFDGLFYCLMAVAFDSLWLLGLLTGAAASCWCLVFVLDFAFSCGCFGVLLCSDS